MNKPQQPMTPEEPQAPGPSKAAGLSAMDVRASIGQTPDPMPHLNAIKDWIPKLMPTVEALSRRDKMSLEQRDQTAQACADLLLEALSLVMESQEHIRDRLGHEARLAQAIVDSCSRIQEMNRFQQKLLSLRRTDRSRMLELIGMLRAEGLAKLDPNTVAPRLLEHLAQMKDDEAALAAMVQENQARDQIQRIMRGAGIRHPKLSDSEGGAFKAPPAG